MNNDTLLQKINYHCLRLGVISTLAFRKESLEEIAEELERMDKICVPEVQK